MGTFLSGALSLFTGGATGVLGAIFSRIFDAYAKKQEIDQLKLQLDHEAVMKDKDAAIMAQEWKARTQVAITEADAAKDVAQSNAFAESLKAQTVVYSAGKQTGPFATACLVLLDVFSGIIRPALTIYLCALTTYIWFEVRGIMNHQTITATEALTLWTLVIDTILYLTTTCILWWFGTRNSQKAPRIK